MSSDLVLHFYHEILVTQVIRLESERTQWEQRYLEESAMRQVAIDAASIPKDAKPTESQYAYFARKYMAAQAARSVLEKKDRE